MTRRESIRAAVMKSRESRLRATERRLAENLDYLRRHDRDGHEQLLAMLKRVVTRAESER